MKFVIKMLVFLTVRTSVSACWISGSACTRVLSRCRRSALEKCYSLNAAVATASYSSAALKLASATGLRSLIRANDGKQNRVGPMQSISENAGGSVNEKGREFLPGTPIMVEILSFGPLGASVSVIGLSHDPDCIIPENEPPLATGLILQKEIHYFRQSRGYVDVILGEVLPAYVERVRDNESAVLKLDIALRVFGGRAKAEEASEQVLQRLKQVGDINLGDKSPPQDVARAFPGMSKGAFKKAIAGLYKQKLISKPGPYSIQLLEQSFIQHNEP